MSPRAGFTLVSEIEPRLKSLIARIKPVGAEDSEELLQDALCVASKMLHDLELRNKEVTPGNICYYVALHMRSGRRSYSAGRTDVMNAGTALDGHSCVLSFEEPAGIDAETGEEVCLGEMLAGHHEDPSFAGARNVDWAQFLGTHDSRYGALLKNLGEGRTVRETGIGYEVNRRLKKQLATDLLEYMGEDAIADSMHEPQWRGSIHAEKERFACRAERRHW